MRLNQLAQDFIHSDPENLQSFSYTWSEPLISIDIHYFSASHQAAQKDPGSFSQ